MALNFGCYSSILPTAKPEDDQALVTVSGVDNSRVKGKKDKD